MAITTSVSAAEYFGSMAESYDSLIRRTAPRYDEMIERLIEYLPPAPARILELGCGTGNLTLRLAERYPSAAITTVDASREMIDVANHRLSRLPASTDRVRFVESKFEELVFPVASFDCVTSCISLHHVHDMAAIYKKVRAWLAPGGTFRFADQLRGAKLADHDLNWRKWLEFSRLPGNCTEAELGSLIDHAAAHDYYVPLPEHFRLLAEAGFDPHSLDCVWRNWMWGIVTAG